MLEINNAGPTGKSDFLITEKIVGISRCPGVKTEFPGDTGFHFARQMSRSVIRSDIPVGWGHHREFRQHTR